MTEGPTTMNGPLHTPNVAMDDRLISATFANQAAAHAAQARLVAAGVAEARVAVSSNAAHDPAAKAASVHADGGLFARIREAVLPEDSERQHRDAVRNDDAILEVRPTAGQVEQVVSILEASNPSSFDAGLERWRNTQ
jgi:hypothetical protein